MRPVANKKGNARGKTPSVVENAPVSVLPDAPDTLGSYGQELWAEVWTAGANAYNPDTDRGIIERYCSLMERRKDHLEVLNYEGWVTDGYKGQPVQHPLARIVENIEQKLVSLEDRLGLNPESRLRLGITAVEHEDKLAAFKREHS